MDKVLKSSRVRLEILPPLPEYARQLVHLVRQNREHLDMWRGDVLKYETEELAFYKLLMDNYYYERKEGYFYHIMRGKNIIGHISLLSSGTFWEISYWLDKGHTGQGYMCEAIKTLEKAWFQNATDPLTIFVRPENSASLNVVRKMGYVTSKGTRHLKNFAMFMEQCRAEQEPKCLVTASHPITHECNRGSNGR